MNALNPLFVKRPAAASIMRNRNAVHSGSPYYPGRATEGSFPGPATVRHPPPRHSLSLIRQHEASSLWFHCMDLDARLLTFAALFRGLESPCLTPTVQIWI